MDIEYVMDSHSGTEVPKKCCSNCHWWQDLHACQIELDIDENHLMASLKAWNIREDYCSRFELRREE